MSTVLRCYALFRSRGGPTFCCIYEGVLWAVAALDGSILGCVLGCVLRVLRAVVPRVNGRCCPALLALFLYCVMRECPTFLLYRHYAAVKCKMA